MKSLASILILVIVINSSCNNPPNRNLTIGQFKWLEGEWVMPDKDGEISEQWKTASDYAMAGISFLKKRDSPQQMMESILLYSKGDEIVYKPIAFGQNDNQSVMFKLTSWSDTGFVAENPEHDFPKRITYRLINKDSLHAYVDGGEAEPGKRQDFYYSRKIIKP